MSQEALKIAERPDERKLVLDVLKRCPSPSRSSWPARCSMTKPFAPQAVETIIFIGEKIKDKDPAAASTAAKQALAAGLADEFSNANALSSELMSHAKAQAQ